MVVSFGLLSACVTSVSPTPAGSDSPSAPSPPAATASVAAPAPSPTPPIALPEPGRPFDAADVLEAMTESRRPGGVPDQLEREPIVSAVAAELWTLDGLPWPQVSAGGSCGTELCTLEVAGSPAGALGEDLYIFEVEAASGRVRVVAAELRGLPPTLADELDAYARARWPDAPLPGPLTSARWLPPPDAGAFVLSYRAGGEEGSPAVDATIDLRSGEVELREPG